MKLALLLSLAASPAFAQLQVFTMQGLEERPVTGLVLMGSVATGEPLELQFRVRNMNPTLALLNLDISGTGFSIQHAPSPPALPPGASLDFIVRYLSSQPAVDARGSLIINTATITLVASSTATLAVTVNNDDGTTSTRISGQSTVFLPAPTTGQSTRHFVLTNSFTQALTVSALAVTGASFHLASAIPTPFTIAAGQTRTIDVVFKPVAIALQKGELVIDERHFPLEGIGKEAQLPRPSIQIPQDGMRSGTQAKIAVKFDSPSLADGAGILRFEFQPALLGPADPAIAFPTASRTSIPFILKTGESQATFSGMPETQLQTGTTAGTLKFTAEIGGYQVQSTVVLAAAPVTVDSVSMRRTTDSVEVTMQGFDNTRSVSRMIFTFYDANDALIQPGDLTADVSQAFHRYFDFTEVGGLFQLKAMFAANTAPETVKQVQIRVENSAGATTTNRLKF